MVKRLLEHPATRGIDLDDPICTEIRKDIIRGNPFLRHIYQVWNDCHKAAIPDAPEGKKVLEIGSGGSVDGDYIARESLVTSDVIPLKDVDLILDAQELDKEFATGSLRAITMMNVLHHIPDVSRLLRAVEHSLMPGGVMSMVEPWPSPWSKLIYKNLQHEPFEVDSSEWGCDDNPLTDANGAIPWIVFQRDRERFDREHPDLEIVKIQPMMPFLYLVSGGVSMRQLQPSFMLKFWIGLERMLGPQMRHLAMFAHIVVRKRG